MPGFLAKRQVPGRHEGIAIQLEDGRFVRGRTRPEKIVRDLGMRHDMLFTYAGLGATAPHGKGVNWLLKVGAVIEGECRKGTRDVACTAVRRDNILVHFRTQWFYRANIPTGHKEIFILWQTVSVHRLDHFIDRTTRVWRAVGDDSLVEDPEIRLLASL